MSQDVPAGPWGDPSTIPNLELTQADSSPPALNNITTAEQH